jgi:hypothetical protein
MTDEIKQLPTFDFNVQLTAQLRNGDEYQTGFTKKKTKIYFQLFIFVVCEFESQKLIRFFFKKREIN